MRKNKTILKRRTRKRTRRTMLWAIQTREDNIEERRNMILRKGTQRRTQRKAQRRTRRRLMFRGNTKMTTKRSINSTERGRQFSDKEKEEEEKDNK